MAELAPSPGPKKPPRKWPRRVLWLLLFLALEAAAFVTLGSLLAQVIEVTWARWVATSSATLLAPLVLAALIAGRVPERRAMAVLGWGFLGLLALGAGLPWLVAHDATRLAVARHGLFAAEQVAGPLSEDTRSEWRRFFER